MASLYYAATIIGVGWLVLQNLFGLLHHGGEGGGTDDGPAETAEVDHSGDLDAHDLSDAHVDHAGDMDAEAHHVGDAVEAAGVPGDAKAGIAPAGRNAHVSPLKPLVLASALGAFGATGSLGSWLSALPAVATAGLALAAGAGCGWAVWRVLLFAATAEGNDTESEADFSGMEGQLTLGCSATAPGEVLFPTGRGIQQYTARPFRPDDQLPAGTRVLVVQVKQGVAYVEAWSGPSPPPLEAEADPARPTRSQPRRQRS